MSVFDNTYIYIFSFLFLSWNIPRFFWNSPSACEGRRFLLKLQNLYNMIIKQPLMNVLEYALVECIYNDIKTLNECFVKCEFTDISLFVYKATDVADAGICDVLAYDVIDMLYNAGLLVFDNGYKVLPVL